MSGFELIRNHPGLSTLIGLEFLLFLIVSYQVQVDERVSLLEKMAMTVFGPVQEVTHNMLGNVSRSVEERMAHEQLVQENDKLRDELESLRRMKTLYVEAARENERLRQVLDMPPLEGWNSIAAEVIGQTHRHDDYMIVINKGSMHGIRPDMGVYGSGGVVGVVWEVSGRFSKVMTVNNPGSVVAALLQNSRFQESYVSGLGSEGGRLDNFPDFEEIRIGDLLLTSGLDGIFPKGLELGVVNRVIKTEGSSEQNVTLDFTIDLARLEMVSVLAPKCDPEAAQ